MSISLRNGCRDLLIEAMRHAAKPICDLSIAEFGNQRIKNYDKGIEMRRLQSAKWLLEFLGARYASFDTNGRDGCVVQDLGVPIVDPNYLGSFDIVTNFGTLEHVRRGQYWAFYNAHALCRPGGLMVHAAPRIGTCAGHGRWHYSVEWFEQLAQTQRYEVLKLNEWDKSEQWADEMKPGEQVYVMAIFRKPRRGDRFMRRRRWVHAERHAGR